MERLSLHMPLADRVYRAILDAICAGELAPGARITQDELAARLDVSRQPVLQALVLLRRQGFVRDSGRRGIVVAPFDRDFVAQLYEVRSALDGAAARGAARRGQADARLSGPGLIAAGRAAVASGSVARMIEADMRFHLFLYDLSGNPLIAETAGLHWHHIRRVMGGYIGRYRGRGEIWDEHEAILRAVVDGAPDEAERLARHHADAAVASLLAMVAAETASGPPEAASRPRRRKTP